MWDELTIIFLLVIVAVLMCIYDGSVACQEKEGIYVRTAFWFECIQEDE